MPYFNVTIWVKVWLRQGVVEGMPDSKFSTLSNKLYHPTWYGGGFPKSIRNTFLSLMHITHNWCECDSVNQVKDFFLNQRG